MFVAFDIEVIFIYLWALVFRDLLAGGLVSMLIFVGVLLLGLAYACARGCSRGADLGRSQGPGGQRARAW